MILGRGVSFIFLLLSRFDWITRISPGFKTAHDRVSTLNTVLVHDQRRTGACIFSRSGAISDIPGIRVELSKPGFCLVDGNVD